MSENTPDATVNIHRHTGGLEKKALNKALEVLIHRHTGGLEKRSTD